MPSEILEKALAIAKQGELTVQINGKTINNDDHIPKAETQATPTVGFPNGNNTSTYLLLNLDLDAPFPSFSVLGPILHLMQPGMKFKTGGDISSDEKPIAPWIPAGPPPPSGAHRYVFLLYEQPAAFNREKFDPANGAPYSTMARIRFDLAKFVREAGLGEPLAGTVFKSN